MPALRCGTSPRSAAHDVVRGRPVVVLHDRPGRTCPAGLCLGQLGQLRGDVRVVDVEVSSTVDRDATREAIVSAAADVERRCEVLRLGAVVAVAHGNAARVAVTWAERHPERVAGLILCAPTGVRFPEARLPPLLVVASRASPPLDTDGADVADITSVVFEEIDGPLLTSSARFHRIVRGWLDAVFPQP